MRSPITSTVISRWRLPPAEGFTEMITGPAVSGARKGTVQSPSASNGRVIVWTVSLPSENPAPVFETEKVIAASVSAFMVLPY